MRESKESPIEFPCRFPLKVFGGNTTDFEGAVIAVVRRHVPDLAEGAVTTRPSSGGKYLAMTVNFTAASREQLDALYCELNSLDCVKMVL